MVCSDLLGADLVKPEEVLHEGAGVAIFNLNNRNLLL